MQGVNYYSHPAFLIDSLNYAPDVVNWIKVMTVW